MKHLKSITMKLLPIALCGALLFCSSCRSNEPPSIGSSDDYVLAVYDKSLVLIDCRTGTAHEFSVPLSASQGGLRRGMRPGYSARTGDVFFTIASKKPGDSDWLSYWSPLGVDKPIGFAKETGFYGCVFNNNGTEMVYTDWSKIYLQEWPRNRAAKILAAADKNYTITCVGCDGTCENIIYCEIPVPTDRKDLPIMVKILDAKTLAVRIVHERHDSAQDVPTMSPDGKYISIHDDEGTGCKILESKTLRQAFHIETKGDAMAPIISALAWSSDSSRVYYSRAWVFGDDGVGVFCYDLKTCKEFRVYQFPMENICVIPGDKAEIIIRHLQSVSKQE